MTKNELKSNTLRKVAEEHPDAEIGRFLLPGGLFGEGVYTPGSQTFYAAGLYTITFIANSFSEGRKRAQTLEVW